MALNPPSKSSLNPAMDSGRGTTPANIDNDDIYARASVPKPAAASGGDDAGSSSSSLRPARPPWPNLLLDSGAAIHVVGDATLLSNLRDAPVGMMVMGADGNTLPVTKIGDITMVAGFRIPDVHFAPGLKFDLISVHELTRHRIWTFFDGDRAMLYEGPELVGQAVAPQDGVYVLKFLSVAPVADAGNDCGLDGELKLVPVWRGSVVGRLKALLRSVVLGRRRSRCGMAIEFSEGKRIEKNPGRKR